MTNPIAQSLMWQGLTKGDAIMVARALDAGADPNLPLEEDLGAIPAASRPLHGAFMPAMDKQSRGPRKHAGKFGVDVGGVVELLLERGADPCALDSKGNTALMVCALHGRVNINARAQERLVKASQAVIDQTHPTQRSTALHLAAIATNTALIRKLLKHGANPNAVDREGATALWPLLSHVDTEHVYAKPATEAAWKGVDALLQAGADINLPNHSGRTPVMAFLRIPVEKMVARGATVTMVHDGHSLLGCVLDAIERNSLIVDYYLPTLEILAQTPGVDWAGCRTMTGKTFRQVLTEAEGKPVHATLAGLLALVERQQLDDTTGTVAHKRGGPRL